MRSMNGSSAYFTYTSVIMNHEGTEIRVVAPQYGILKFTLNGSINE